MSWVIAQPPTGQPLPPTGPLQPSNDSLLSTTPARGSLALRNAFVAGEERGRAAFISYFLAGYPAPEDTVDILLAMERGGTDVIELGVPFSNPTADGPTIQKAHAAVLSSANPTTLTDTLNLAKKARARGLKVPIVLMGYFNPFVAFGARRLMTACVESGIDGFIIVDLPPEVWLSCEMRLPC